MNVGSTKEKNPEKRISITPDTSKSLKNLGLNVFLEKGYGESLGYSDQEYKDKGAQILNDAKEVLSKSDLITGSLISSSSLISPILCLGERV